MLNEHVLRLADNGLANGATGSRLLIIDDSDLRMGQCTQPAKSGRGVERPIVQVRHQSAPLT